MKHKKKIEKLNKRQEAHAKMVERGRLNPAAFKKPGSIKKRGNHEI